MNDPDPTALSDETVVGVALSYNGTPDAPVWADVKDGDAIQGAFARATFMPDMTVAGKPTIEMLILTEEGDLVHTSVTWAMFGSMAKIFTQWEQENRET